MPIPPTPLTPADFLAAVARYVWYQTTGSLGRIGSSSTTLYWIVVRHGGVDGTWELVETDPTSSGFDVVLCDEDTFDTMAGGTLNTDGSIHYGSTDWRIQSFFDGSNWTAKRVVA